MSLLVRLFLMLLLQSRGRTAGPFDVTVVRSRVMPNDLDLNRHVNNGRVLTLADLGRVDWFLRTGCLRVALKRGWAPIVGDATARFVRELKVFEPFTIESRMLGYGVKWAYLEHRLLRRNGALAAVVVIRGMFHGGRQAGAIPPATMFAATGRGELPPSPALPAWVEAWSKSLDLLSESVRKPADTVATAEAGA